ncbi:MAG: lytic transglycosylase domain-containing protein [Betaproteobacteria bacterium]|nr:MAG: lytic transglycosylase domain-containing protein [Betaproteobacteria bacterium]
MRELVRWTAITMMLFAHGFALAGAQRYEPLAASVQAALSKAVSDRAPLTSAFASKLEEVNWLSTMSRRLEKRMRDHDSRVAFLKSVHYEASRAGLDPQLVLGLIQVESGFKKYAVSRAGARGYMQVMPFWAKLIGAKGDNLFDMRKNIRYGCTILRHYLDLEQGDLFRALGRYNGSLGKSDYPRAVEAAWKQGWHYDSKRH